MMKVFTATYYITNVDQYGIKIIEKVMKGLVISKIFSFQKQSLKTLYLLFAWLRHTNRSNSTPTVW